MATHVNPLTVVTPTATSGNWFIYNLSVKNVPSTAVNGLPNFIGGSLVVSNNQVSGVFHMDQACVGSVATDIPYTGTIKGDQITLNSASVNGEVLTVQGTLTTSGTSFRSESLTLNGTCSGNVAADTGSQGAGASYNAIGAQLPALNGIWATNPANPNPQLSFKLIQAPTADAHGRFALSGTVTVQGSPCFSSGTVQTSSYISGSTGQLTILFNEGSTLKSPLVASPQLGTTKTNLTLGSANITGGNCNAIALFLPLQ